MRYRRSFLAQAGGVSRRADARAKAAEECAGDDRRRPRTAYGSIRRQIREDAESRQSSGRRRAIHKRLLYYRVLQRKPLRDSQRTAQPCQWAIRARARFSSFFAICRSLSPAVPAERCRLSHWCNRQDACESDGRFRWDLDGKARIETWPIWRNAPRSSFKESAVKPWFLHSAMAIHIARQKDLRIGTIQASQRTRFDPAKVHVPAVSAG